MEAKQTEIVRTTIDLPAALNEKLLARCAETKRSRHAEMIFLLEKSFENAPNGNGKKEKAK
jgi:hypothetical protein